MIENKKRLKVSFSGGETSGFMLIWMKENMFHKYDEVIVAFANTSQENEETLIFVDKVSKTYGIPVVWLEAVVNPGKRQGTRHKVVDFATASRDGSVFESVIAKYGIPNPDFQPCNRELKTNAMDSYCASIGWKKGTYDTAIGIRVDEIDRMSSNADKQRLIYPLIKNMPMTKPMINDFWSRQPFRLLLKGYEGNCKWCWKKSLRKHLTIISDHPDRYDFPERMEREYGMAGARKEGDTKPRVFYRNYLSTLDLRRLAKEGNFKRADDDAVVLPQPSLFDYELDKSYGCSESCEPYN